MKLVDSHCHLDDESFEADRDAVIQRALDAGVEYMMTIGAGAGPPDLEAAIRLAERYEPVWATVGVQPHDASKASDDTLPRLEELLAHPKVLALGEIGLDYHYEFSPRQRQRDLFAHQLDLAARHNRPVVIHTREAWDDTLMLLAEHWRRESGGIMHCFTGGPAEAQRCLAMGFHLSYSGIVTYSSAREIQEAARVTPLDRILIETDAPYLAPVPYRGKVRRNEPAFVVETARKLAALKNVEVEAIAEAASDNWRRLCQPGGLRSANASG